MGGADRHARPWGIDRAAEAAPVRPRSPARLGVTAAVAAFVSVATMIAGVLTVSPAPAAVSGAGGAVAGQAGALAAAPGAALRRAQAASGRQADPLALTAADRRACPAAVTACVDLARHLTWLQRGGRVVFGPVQMEPGKPGSAHPTPRGTFKVEWKAGPSFASDIYHEPMPWATFFAAGGIAFHGGSLTQWSHGCIHLTVANAHYYNVHLRIGAQVVVF
jgi:lipoprotein-anchoring transpeptidase ErfK/SrfK